MISSRRASSILLLTVLFAVPNKALVAERPIVHTAIFAPNYHYLIDTDDRVTFSGENFGNASGHLIRIDNNKEIRTRDFEYGPAWSNNAINFFPADNIDVLSVGPNQIIVRAADGLESDPFTINFEKYWVGPRIFSISPSTIHLGGVIEITGENFGDGTSNNGRVLDGGSPNEQTIQSWSDTKIRAQISNITEWNRTTGLTTIFLKTKCDSGCTIGNSNLVDYISNAFSIKVEEQSSVPPTPTPDTAPPILSSVRIASTHPGQPSIATGGDTVNLTFTSNEPLFWFAVNWTTGGHPAVLPGGYINTSGNTWEAHLHVKAEDANGPVGFTINYEDAARNYGTVTSTTDGSYVIVDNTRACVLSDWSCGTWSVCSSSGQQSRICTKMGTCEGGVTPPTSQSCSVGAPACTGFTYSDWDACREGWQFRSIVSTTPSTCTGGNPVLAQPCQLACTENDWSCGTWSMCTDLGMQTRSCTKIGQCEGGVIPISEKMCKAQCENNGWNCTDWSACSSDGKQTRTCERCKENPGSSPTLEKQCVYKQPKVEPFTARDVVIKRSGPKGTLYYLGADGKRYVFPNELVFKSWFKDFTDVFELADNQLFDLPLAGNITYRPGVKMVKIETDPRVYAVAPGGVLRWVVSETVAEQLYGPDWNKKIDDVPEIFFINYTFGQDIDSASAFDPMAASQAATSVNDDKHIPHSDKPRLSNTKPDTGESRKK